MKIIPKIKCKLGKHDWMYVTNYLDDNTTNKYRSCIVCGKELSD